MKIEKVSTYIVASTPSRSSGEQSTMRKILLSLPRVRWLERDNPQSVGDIKRSEESDKKYIILNSKERDVLKLHEEGNSEIQIANKRAMSLTAVKRTILRAKKKLALRSRGREYIASADVVSVDDTN